MITVTNVNHSPDAKELDVLTVGNYIDKLLNKIEAAEMVEAQQNRLIDALIQQNERLHRLLDGCDSNETRRIKSTGISRSVVSIRYKAGSRLSDMRSNH